MDISFWQRAIPSSIGAPCAWCATGVEMVGVGSGVVADVKDTQYGEKAVLAALFVCPRPSCRQPTLVFLEARYTSRWNESVAVDRIAQLPRGKARPIDDLPEPIARDREEAWSCYFGGDLRAAVIMGRAAIQRAVRHLKAEGAGLKAEIQDLRNKGVITSELKKWADEVRIAGDEAAHPEELGEINDAEAKEGLEFMDEFLRHSVAMPERRRRREAARKSEASSG